MRTRCETLERERGRDKERWKERMCEVEDGVGGLVKEVEDPAANAERKAWAASQHAKRAEQAVNQEQLDRGLREEPFQAEEENKGLRDDNGSLKTWPTTVEETKASLQKHASQRNCCRRPMNRLKSSTQPCCHRRPIPSVSQGSWQGFRSSSMVRWRCRHAQTEGH